jgi:hypothetical protein
MVETLFNKISSYDEEIYGDNSILDSFDILTEFRKLYEALKNNDVRNAIKIMKSLSTKDKLKNFIEYAEAKSHQMANVSMYSDQDIKKELQNVISEFNKIYNEMNLSDFTKSTNAFRAFEMLFGYLKNEDIKPAKYLINKLREVDKLKFFKVYVHELKKNNLFSQKEIEEAVILFNSLLD